MILASAQTKPKFRDIVGNLLDHYKLVDFAADMGADLIVFPELSITGYELEMAETIAFSVDDLRIRRLREMSTKKDIVIVAGAPIQINSELFIGEFIISPDHSLQIYTKHFLHPGEDNFYKPSFDFDPVIDFGEERVAFAICADIDHPEHPEQAAAKGATVYIPSIFFSPNGIPDAYSKLGEYSKKYSLNILMSNYCGESMRLPAAGRSAFWNNHGELVGEMNSSDTGLLLTEKKNGAWTNKIISYH